MKIDLTERTALVTGSTQGIGFAIAAGLARAGASVWLNGLTNAEVSSAVERLKSLVPGAVARGIVADVATSEGAARMVGEAKHVDVLVNNAGIYSQFDFFEAKDEDWLRTHEVNVMGGVRTARAYAQEMANRGWGRIIFLSSESALTVPVDMIHYAATKTANLAVSRGLAKRLAGTGVTVNAVLPGPTLSEGVQALLEDVRARTGKTIEEVATDFVVSHRPSSIIRRAATMEEVANLVVYLASPQASATTGAAMRVDGGVVDTIA